MKGENRERAIGFAHNVHHRYHFINKNLLNNTYEDGDVYDHAKLDEMRSQWETQPNKPYLQHVKFLANAWPHLRMLSDFMEVSTTPLRWKRHFQVPGKADIHAQEQANEDRKERWSRTNVARLDYMKSGKVEQGSYEDASSLDEALNAEKPGLSNVQLRLWVVEDLSRDVIELLGSTYDIEPAFFREHILDYAWHNVRDYWRDPPNLEIVARKQHWTQIRFVRARYFSTTKAFREGFHEAERFNVLRRPDDDENNRTFWDKHDAKIGLMRSRASFWLRRPKQAGEPAIGVLLLDPTLTAGFPLWRGYRNWESAPNFSDDQQTPLPTSPDQSERSFFEDFLYWARKPDVFSALAASSEHALLAGPSAPHTHSHIHVPVQALLHLICAEWLTISDYIKTRLTQIDWEIAYPETFLRQGAHAVKVDISLKKLHIWRRYVPIFREMISETLEHVFHFPCHAPTFPNAATGGDGPGLTALPAGVPPAAPPMTTAGAAPLSAGGGEQATHARPIPGAIQAYEHDFALALGYMEEYQQRIDRLTTVVTAVMSIADSRRALADNKNIGRLTWLATFFVPFSLVAATFSMQANVTDITGETVRWFFIVAAPVSICTLALAIALSHDKVRRALGLGPGLRGWLNAYGI